MGNLIADALVARTRSQGVTIAIVNGGGFRASIDAGPVTMGEILTVLPFQNVVSTMGLKGSDIVAALEHGLSQVESGGGRFAQVSGLRYVGDLSRPAMGGRVVLVEVRDGDGWKPIDPAATYLVATNDFMRRGGDGYKVFATRAIKPYDGGPSLEDVVAEYLAATGAYTPKLDGRITVR